jgi:hypothetical protein
MGADASTMEAMVKQILAILESSFIYHWDFWITNTLGVAAIGFSFAAFYQAKQARKAAIEAGITVKLQTITIDLTEIAQKLNKLEPNITFSNARDLLNEISYRLRRVMSPFANDLDLKITINSLRQALDTAKASLDAVRPADPAKELETPRAVYNAVQGELATINSFVADLAGLFESKTQHLSSRKDAQS